MASSVSVLTPTVAGRSALFGECVDSVAAQTITVQHLARHDTDLVGCAKVRNALARIADTPWLLPLDDDDLLLPGCVETLLAHANGPRTIVYSRPLVWGEDPAQFLGQPPCIPATALISRDLWMELGGLNERLREREDRDLWERALAAGANFVCVDDRPTWVYRFHGGNKSRNNGKIP